MSSRCHLFVIPLIAFVKPKEGKFRCTTTFLLWFLIGFFKTLCFCPRCVFAPSFPFHTGANNVPSEDESSFRSTACDVFILCSLCVNFASAKVFFLTLVVSDGIFFFPTRAVSFLGPPCRPPRKKFLMIFVLLAASFFLCCSAAVILNWTESIQQAKPSLDHYLPLNQHQQTLACFDQFILCCSWPPFEYFSES